MRLWVLLAAFILAACGSKSVSPTFHVENNPALLSEWGVVNIQDGQLQLGTDVLPYSLNSALFTDYAHKLRTIWMPQGVSAQYREGGVLDFPVGTIISKTFYYPSFERNTILISPDLQPVTQRNGLKLADHQLIETRLLVRREDGWEPLSYVWNDDQTKAKLTRIGALKKLTLSDEGKSVNFSYLVPNINQCAGCHAPNNTTRELSPVGPKPRHLNGEYKYSNGSMNQLEKLTDVGYLSGAPDDRPKATMWDNREATLDDRARAYLDINCAHCHNPVGPADTSGLHLNPENESQPHLGICKNAVAAGGGTGGRQYDITPGAPEKSIFVYRMETRDPGAMMPELGRSLVHEEGVELIAEWISAMDGPCN